MPTCDRLLLLGLGLYAAGVSWKLHTNQAKASAVRARDFASSAAGSCLCGENEFCLCTPSLASDIIIELEGVRSLLPVIYIIITFLC